MDLVERVEAALPADVAGDYRRCIQAPARTLQDLQGLIEGYLAKLRQRALEAEFLDLATAAEVAQGCRALLRRLDQTPEPANHRAVQAAIEYFVLEDDGQEDGSIVGFDDDLEVVQVTARVLGWELPEGQA